jgi:hypothetical protein
VVRAFCRRAIEWRSLGVHVEIRGHETNECEVCSCGLRLHGKSIDKAVGHLDAQQQPTKLFVRNFEFYHYDVVCQECGVRSQANKTDFATSVIEARRGLDHIKHRHQPLSNRLLNETAGSL